MSEYVLYDHDQEGQLDTEGLVRISRASDVIGWDVSTHNLKNRGLDIGVGDSFDVAISHAFIPYL